MCGRFTSLLSPELLTAIYEVFPPKQIAPRYNIVPTQEVLVVREASDGSRYLSAVRWGLVPHWAKDASLGSKMINARSETVHEKASFRQAIRHRRCIVPISGFYEWVATPGGKHPHYITTRDGSPLSSASIWDINETPDGQILETCSILTTAANSLMAPLHDRMPVILHQGEFYRWLDPADTVPQALQHFYQSYPSELMQEWPVSPLLNSPRCDSPACIAPV